MLEPILENGLHLGCAFVTEERVQAFVNKFLDQASTFSQSDKVVLLLVSQSCHGGSRSQVCWCEAILNECGSN